MKFVTLALLLAFASDSLAQGFGGRKVSVVCEPGEELCWTNCYNPKTQKCYGSSICDLDQTVCGRECVSPDSEKVCLEHKEWHYQVLCEAGQSLCGSTCYSADVQDCLGDDRVCSKGEDACSLECFAPSASKSCLKGKYGSYLCEAGERVCGSWGCYSAGEKVCFEDQDWICNVREELCGRGCYNPGAGETCNTGDLVCKAGEQVCGTTGCVGEGQICLSNSKVCNVGQSLCGDDSCYDESAGEQCFKPRPDYSVICAAGEDYCHYNCFNPATDSCVNTESADFRKVCPKGHQVCQGKLSPNSWGYGCFDPAVEECLSRPSGNILCQTGQAACGGACYVPAETTKVCLESGILCEPGQATCGGRCYSPDSQTCFKDVDTHMWGGKK